MRHANRTVRRGSGSSGGGWYDDSVHGVEEVLDEKYGSRGGWTQKQFFALVVVSWIMAGLTAMYATTHVNVGADYFNHEITALSSLRKIPTASATKPQQPAQAPEAISRPSSGFVRKLDPLNVLVISMLASHPYDYKERVLWSSVTANLQGPRGQKEREQMVRNANEIANRVILENGGEIWDDPSCYNTYEKECVSWAAREPSECVINGDMLSSCRKLCGYCGALSILAKEIDAAREKDKKIGADMAQGGIADLDLKPANVPAGSAAESGDQAKDQSMFIESLIVQALKDRIPFKAEEADEYIRKAMKEHEADYPPDMGMGIDPMTVADKNVPSGDTAKRECAEVLSTGREQTNALRTFGIASKGPERKMGGPKVLCVLLTEEKHSPTTAVALKTWGWKCDGFMAVGEEADDETGTLKLPFGEGLKGAWEQTRAALVHIWRYHISAGQKYDAVILLRGRQYVIAENLRLLLQGKSADVPRAYGRVVSRSGSGHDIYLLGGGGIVLNAATIRILVARMWMGGCAPKLDAGWWDVMMFKCLRAGDFDKYPGLNFDDDDFGPDDAPAWLKQPVLPEDTRDSTGRQYFMPFALSQHLTFTYTDDDWYSQYSRHAPGGWSKTGKDCCSSDSVSFAVSRDGQMAEIAAYLKFCVPTSK